MERCSLVAIFLLFVGLVVLPRPATCAEAKFDRDHIRLEDRAEDNTLVIVKITSAAITSEYPYKNAYMWGGDEERMPTKVITGMDIKAGEKKIHVPLSAYCDLGDPNHVWLKSAPRGFAIRIQGADAGNAYDSTLFFANNRIERKLTTLGEFPDAAEDIRYTYPTFNEDQ